VLRGSPIARAGHPEVTAGGLHTSQRIPAARCQTYRVAFCSFDPAGGFIPGDRDQMKLSYLDAVYSLAEFPDSIMREWAQGPIAAAVELRRVARRVSCGLALVQALM